MRYIPFTILMILFGCFGYLTYDRLDGHLFNKPYIPCTDIQNLQVEKPMYHIGETVKYHACATRTRNYEVRTTWRIVNATTITYPTKGIQTVSPGEIDAWVAIGDIPKYATPGTHHIEGTAEIFIHRSDEDIPENTIYINFRSQDFEVVE